MRNILLIGPQGSGKGTQAERLSRRLGIPIVSVGHLLRNEIEKHTGLGKSIEEYVTAGDRVPGDVVDQIVAARIEEPDAENGVIMDGYPRAVEQVSALEGIFGRMGRKITEAVLIRVSDEVSLERLSGRWVCSNTKCEANYHERFNPPKGQAGVCDVCGSPLTQRDDDKPDAIRRRLELYHKDTEPLISKYREAGVLHEVDGDQDIDAVERDIIAALGL